MKKPKHGMIRFMVLSIAFWLALFFSYRVGYSMGRRDTAYTPPAQIPMPAHVYMNCVGNDPDCHETHVTAVVPKCSYADQRALETFFFNGDVPIVYDVRADRTVNLAVKCFGASR